MFPRVIIPRVIESAAFMPVVSVTGPRQSGKTTLCRAAFPDKAFVSLEDPPMRARAVGDPRAFLAQHPEGAIVDEAQYAPDLFSHIQVIVDEHRRNGEWVLTGSQHFGLARQISQSLAGRVAIHHLLPLGLEELRGFASAPASVQDAIFSGGYPAIHDRGIAAREWLTSYVRSYLERDVRDLITIGETVTFQTFMQLCAGRNARELNMTSLAGDVGVSPNTIRSWLSVLETSFIVVRLLPLLPNWNKRLTRTPKLLFIDSGLVCNLLGLLDAEQLSTHPLRGSLFEGWVISEVLKARMHRGFDRGLWYYREHGGLEVDLIVERHDDLLAVEIKSGQTVNDSFFASLERFEAVARTGPEAHKPLKKLLVYAGDRRYEWRDVELIPWHAVADVDWT